MGRRKSPNRWLEAFDPRVPLYRDTYNEYLVFIVSAIGSVAGTQVPLYLVMALTDLWPVEVFVPACMVFELARDLRDRPSSDEAEGARRLGPAVGLRYGCARPVLLLPRR